MRVFVIAGSPGGQPPATLAPDPGDRVIAADYGAFTARGWGWPVHLLIGDLDSLPADEVAVLRAEGVPVRIAPQEKDETDLELALMQALKDGAEEIVICAALGGRADHLLANVLLLARPELAGVDVAIADGPVTIRLMRGGDAAPPVRAQGASSATHVTLSGLTSQLPSRRAFSEESPRSTEGDSSLFWPAGGASETKPLRMTPKGRSDLAPGRESGSPGRAHLKLDGAAGDLLSLLPIGGNAAGVTTRGLAYPLRDETLYLGRARGVSNVFETERAEIRLRTGLLLVIHTGAGERR
jgi:thiamine pyrophosphokinase